LTVCLFCIAVFAILAGAVTSAVLDQFEARLATVAADNVVNRMTESGSAVLFALDVSVPAVPGSGPPALPTAPVEVTVFKAQKRIKIQVRTHAVTPPQAAAIQDLIAAHAGLVIVQRSSTHTQEIVQNATAQLQQGGDPSEPTWASERSRIFDSPRDLRW
jgi:hypothetical protein